MPNKSKKQKPRTGPAKYPGITRDAKALGVSRNHLYLVLEGQRTSSRLIARYLKLQRKAA